MVHCLCVLLIRSDLKPGNAKGCMSRVSVPFSIVRATDTTLSMSDADCFGLRSEMLFTCDLGTTSVCPVCELGRRTCPNREHVEKCNHVVRLGDNVCRLTPLDNVAKYALAFRHAPVVVRLEPVEQVRGHRRQQPSASTLHAGWHGATARPRRAMRRSTGGAMQRARRMDSRCTFLRRSCGSCGSCGQYAPTRC